MSDRTETTETMLPAEMPSATMPMIPGRRLYARRWDSWHEGLFDGMEAAAAAYARGERLPSEENTMFWDWAQSSFHEQGRRAAEEVTQELEQLDAADDAPPLWDLATWRVLGKRSYATGYAWALQVEIRRLLFGGLGVYPEDRAAYIQARGTEAERAASPMPWDVVDDWRPLPITPASLQLLADMEAPEKRTT